MLKIIESYITSYQNYKARTALLDFAGNHINSLSVSEITKIMEVVNIIREYEKLDNKSNP